MAEIIRDDLEKEKRELQSDVKELSDQIETYQCMFLFRYQFYLSFLLSPM